METIKRDKAQRFSIPCSLQVIIGIIYGQRCCDILHAFVKEAKLEAEMHNREAENDERRLPEKIILIQQKLSGIGQKEKVISAPAL